MLSLLFLLVISVLQTLKEDCDLIREEACVNSDDICWWDSTKVNTTGHPCNKFSGSCSSIVTNISADCTKAGLGKTSITRCGFTVHTNKCYDICDRLSEFDCGNTVMRPYCTWKNDKCVGCGSYTNANDCNNNPFCVFNTTCDLGCGTVHLNDSINVCNNDVKCYANVEDKICADFTSCTPISEVNCKQIEASAEVANSEPRCGWDNDTGVCKVYSTFGCVSKSKTDCYSKENECFYDSYISKCIEFEKCSDVETPDKEDCNNAGKGDCLWKNGSGCVYKCVNLLTRSDCEKDEREDCWWNNTVPTQEAEGNGTVPDPPDPVCENFVSCDRINAALPDGNDGDNLPEKERVCNENTKGRCYWNTDTKKCVDFTKCGAINIRASCAIRNRCKWNATVCIDTCNTINPRRQSGPEEGCLGSACIYPIYDCQARPDCYYDFAYSQCMERTYVFGEEKCSDVRGDDVTQTSCAAGKNCWIETVIPPPQDGDAGQPCILPPGGGAGVIGACNGMLVCYTNNTCGVGQRDGEDCSGNRDCASADSICYSFHTCGPPLQVGSSCGGDDDCAGTAICTAGICVAAPGDAGQSCLPGDLCNGVLVCYANSTCGVGKEDGEDCLGNRDCASAGSICYSFRTCGPPLQVGSSCGGDDDCAGAAICAADICVAPGDAGQPCLPGGLCNGMLVCYANSTCGVGKEDGESCSENRDCVGVNSICYANLTCGPPLPEGSICGSDDDCAGTATCSGTCIAASMAAAVATTTTTTTTLKQSRQLSKIQFGAIGPDSNPQTESQTHEERLLQVQTQIQTQTQASMQTIARQGQRQEQGQGQWQGEGYQQEQKKHGQRMGNQTPQLFCRRFSGSCGDIHITDNNNGEVACRSIRLGGLPFCEVISGQCMELKCNSGSFNSQDKCNGRNDCVWSGAGCVAFSNCRNASTAATCVKEKRCIWAYETPTPYCLDEIYLPLIDENADRTHFSTEENEKACSSYQTGDTCNAAAGVVTSQGTGCVFNSKYDDAACNPSKSMCQNFTKCEDIASVEVGGEFFAPQTDCQNKPGCVWIPASTASTCGSIGWCVTKPTETECTDITDSVTCDATNGTQNTLSSLGPTCFWKNTGGPQTHQCLPWNCNLLNKDYCLNTPSCEWPCNDVGCSEPCASLDNERCLVSWRCYWKDNKCQTFGGCEDVMAYDQCVEHFKLDENSGNCKSEKCVWVGYDALNIKVGRCFEDYYARNMQIRGCDDYQNAEQCTNDTHFRKTTANCNERCVYIWNADHTGGRCMLAVNELNCSVYINKEQCTNATDLSNPTAGVCYWTNGHCSERLPCYKTASQGDCEQIQKNRCQWVNNTCIFRCENYNLPEVTSACNAGSGLDKDGVETRYCVSEAGEYGCRVDCGLLTSRNSCNGDVNCEWKKYEQEEGCRCSDKAIGSLDPLARLEDYEMCEELCTSQGRATCNHFPLGICQWKSASIVGEWCANRFFDFPCEKYTYTQCVGRISDFCYRIPDRGEGKCRLNCSGLFNTSSDCSRNKKCTWNSYTLKCEYATPNKLPRPTDPGRSGAWGLRNFLGNGLDDDMKDDCGAGVSTNPLRRTLGANVYDSSNPCHTLNTDRERCNNNETMCGLGCVWNSNNITVSANGRCFQFRNCSDIKYPKFLEPEIDCKTKTSACYWTSHGCSTKPESSSGGGGKSKLSKGAITAIIVVPVVLVVIAIVAVIIIVFLVKRRKEQGGGGSSAANIQRYPDPILQRSNEEESLDYSNAAYASRQQPQTQPDGGEYTGKAHEEEIVAENREGANHENIAENPGDQ